MPDRVVFLDTSFILALENKDDPHHARAKALDSQLLAEKALLLSHWGIFLEIADGYARISRRAKGMQLLAKLENEEGYRICPITEPLFQEALALYRARSDKEWGLTDCISFTLMAREGVSELSEGKYQFVIIYENHDGDLGDGAEFWVGKAEPVAEFVIKSR